MARGALPLPFFMHIPLTGIDRSLARALAISLAAHGLAFWSVPTVMPPITSGGLRASLRQAPAAAPTDPADMRNLSRATAPKPRILDGRQARERPIDEPGTARATTPAEDRPPTAATPLASDTSTIDPVGLRQYHFALGRATSRFRIYPPQAREAGWEGRVTLRLAMVAGGIPRDLILLTSSGYPALDQAAQEMLRQSIGHTPVPETLRGQPFTIDLAIDFNLTDSASAPPR